MQYLTTQHLQHAQWYTCTWYIRSKEYAKPSWQVFDLTPKMTTRFTEKCKCTEKYLSYTVYQSSFLCPLSGSFLLFILSEGKKGILHICVYLLAIFMILHVRTSLWFNSCNNHLTQFSPTTNMTNPNIFEAWKSWIWLSICKTVTDEH